MEIAECCCMCGDPGLSHELVPCGSCHTRFQHRYCSNQYPDASSYETCNWCLSNGGSPNGKQGKTSSQELLLSSCESPQKRKLGKRLVGQMKKRRTLLLRQTSVRDGDGDSSGEPGMRKGETRRAGITRYGLRNRAVRRYKLLEEVAA
ncbi:hypothetical protein MLD38_022413 [Melastoma candidum]|uniref:Uncharacterized protein n=1 Tax=Melastoma candidum TaxID=119954 RepID=A0ACB9QJ67_9MYRT|nr:hypothetical protein MLD38_022413 [Melastoma candidum]